MNTDLASVQPELSGHQIDRATLHAFIQSLDANDPDNREKIKTVNERVIAGEAKEMGVSRIEVNFAGCGDSGELDDPIFNNVEGTELELNTSKCILFIKSERKFKALDRTWGHEFYLEECQLDDAVTQHVDGLLEDNGTNWYDQDGGSGHYIMDLEANTAELAINVNVVESHCEHSETKEIGVKAESGQPVDLLAGKTGRDQPAQ